MFCPNCAVETARHQKFCRSCGLPLAKFADALDEIVPPSVRDDQQRKKEFLINAGAVVGLIAFVLLVGAVIFGIVKRLIVVPGKTTVGVVLLTIIVLGLAFLIRYVFLLDAEERRNRRLVRRRDEQLLFERSEQNRLEAAHFESVVPGSVVERTTDLLPVERRPITDEFS